MSNIPTPFVGGTDSPRRGSAEEKALQPPYAPGWQTAAEPEAAAPTTDEETGSARPIKVEVDELDEEDLLPDMSTEGEEIAIEGPTYDLEWPEEPEPELAAEAAETADSAPVPEVGTTPEAAEVTGEGTEMPDFLLGPDSSESEVAVEPASEEPGLPKEELLELSLKLLEGALGDSIRALVADLRVYTADIAVPRAFAAGYLAARKEEK